MLDYHTPQHFFKQMSQNSELEKLEKHSKCSDKYQLITNSTNWKMNTMLTKTTTTMVNQKLLKSHLMYHTTSNLSTSKLAKVNWWRKSHHSTSLRQWPQELRETFHWTSALCTCKTKMVMISWDISELTKGLQFPIKDKLTVLNEKKRANKKLMNLLW